MGTETTFGEWIDFEANKIESMDLRVSEKNRANYMKDQIRGALETSFSRGKDGLTKTDEPRVSGERPT